MKYPFIILALLLGNFSLSAQIEREPPVVGKMDTISFTASNEKKNKQSQKDLLKDLDLTKEQKSKLKEIHQSGKAKKEAIENNDQLSEPEKKTKLKELQKEQAQKIQAILTDEQKEKLKAMRQEAMKEKNQ